MSDYIIVTDSTANLPEEMIEKYNLKILSLNYYVDDKEYKGYVKGENNDLSAFYKMMREKKDIKIRTDEEKKEITTRINRIIGQLNGVKNMVLENRYCNDVLIQLSAIDKSIKSLANVVLDSHMHTCLIEHIENKDYGIIDEIIDLVKRFQ